MVSETSLYFMGWPLVFLHLEHCCQITGYLPEPNNTSSIKTCWWASFCQVPFTWEGEVLSTMIHSNRRWFILIVLLHISVNKDGRVWSKKRPCALCSRQFVQKRYLNYSHICLLFQQYTTCWGVKIFTQYLWTFCIKKKEYCSKVFWCYPVAV